MHPHRLGELGERLACLWLRCCGFAVLRTRFRKLRAEVDIVARSGGVLHVVEVKTRTRFSHGGPLGAVGRTKRRQQVKVARELLGLPGCRGCVISFDVIEVWLQPRPTLRHLVDAWRAPEDGWVS